MRRLALSACALAVVGSMDFAGLQLWGGPGWSEEEPALVRSLSFEALPPVPPDPSNRVADDPAVVELGREIFFHFRFSGNGEIACASCHDPSRQFQDDLPLGQGMRTTNRRTMPIAGMAHAPVLFWTGARTASGRRRWGRWSTRETARSTLISWPSTISPSTRRSLGRCPTSRPCRPRPTRRRSGSSWARGSASTATTGRS